MVLYSKHIILEDEEFDGFLELEGGKVKALHQHWNGSYQDFNDNIVLPGFMDIHIHGWATGSFWFEKSRLALKEMNRTLPYAGVTSYLATSGADTISEIKQCIAAADEAYEADYPGAEMLGMHLEGPFINPEYRGMQREECCILPSISAMEELYGSFRHKELCRHMTLAVEQTGARDVLDFCRSHRIQTSIGHSGADFRQIKELRDSGIGGVTHMFSGMVGFHHRELGVAGAALYFDDLMCEFAKQTGLTVTHEAFDIAYRVKGSDRIIMCTDCSGLAQTLTEFDHYVRKMKFIKDGDMVRIAHYDGREEWINPRDYDAVKDIELSYVKSIQNMAEHTCVNWHDIMKMTSLNPARYIHVYDRKGSIAPGKDADLTIVDKNLNLIGVFCRGKEFKELL